MIHLSHRIKEAGEVAPTALLLLDWNVAGGLAEGIDVVMAGDTIIANIIVTESHRLPTEIGMTIRTLVMHRNMIHWLASNDDIVMAILAAAKNLVVIHHGNCLKSDSAVAGVAAFAGKDVFNRFRCGVETAIDTVAGDTLGWRASELATHVATLAGHKVMAAGEFKAGCRVIEGLVLPQRYAAETSRQHH